MPVRLGGKQKYRLSRRLIREGTVPKYRLHIVALFGMQEEALTTSATLSAPATWNISLSVWRHPSFYRAARVRILLYPPQLLQRNLV